MSDKCGRIENTTGAAANETAIKCLEDTHFPQEKLTSRGSSDPQRRTPLTLINSTGRFESSSTMLPDMHFTDSELDSLKHSISKIQQAEQSRGPLGEQVKSVCAYSLPELPEVHFSPAELKSLTESISKMHEDWNKPLPNGAHVKGGDFKIIDQGEIFRVSDKPISLHNFQGQHDDAKTLQSK